MDLHLIHWPNLSVDRYPEAWRALVDLREQGLVRTTGVSNFTEVHLHRLHQGRNGVTPAVNQVELHPDFNQQAMRDVHERLGIRTEAWSPMGKQQAPFDEPPVAEAAQRHDVTPGQVILRWHVQLRSLAIPKSATPQRQRQNLDAFGSPALRRGDGRDRGRP